MKINDEKIKSRISELLYRRNLELIEISNWIVKVSNRIKVSSLNTENYTRNIDENVELLKVKLIMNSNLIIKF